MTRPPLPGPLHYLKMAYMQAELSQDPSTQNGAVIIASHGACIGVGHNRFAQGLLTTPERLVDRSTKLSCTVHAETAVIYDVMGTSRSRLVLASATLYACWAACEECAKDILESGVRRVVVHADHPGFTKPGAWQGSVERGLAMLREAGVDFLSVAGPIGGVRVRFGGVTWEP